MKSVKSAENRGKKDKKPKISMIWMWSVVEQNLFGMRISVTDNIQVIEVLWFFYSFLNNQLNSQISQISQSASAIIFLTILLIFLITKVVHTLGCHFGWRSSVQETKGHLRRQKNYLRLLFRIILITKRHFWFGFLRKAARERSRTSQPPPRATVAGGLLKSTV